MLGVAGGVFCMFQIERSVGSAFRVLALHETVALRCLHVRDIALFRFEIEGHEFAVVVVAALRIDWFVLQDARRVALSRRSHHAAVHVHGDFGRVERHVHVFHLGLSVEVHQSRFSVVDQRVCAFIVHWRVDARFAFRAVGRRGVDGRAVVAQSASASGVGGIGQQQGVLKTVGNGKRHGSWLLSCCIVL